MKTYMAAVVGCAVLLSSLPLYALTSAVLHEMAAATAPWPMFRQNARHTGLSPFHGPDSVALAWSYMTGNDVYFSSPAIGSDGRVYVGSKDHKLYGFHSDGSLLWTYGTGDPVESSPAIGSDGKVYVGSDDQRLYALTSAGSLAWSYLTGGAVDLSSPAIDSNGRVHVVSRHDALYVFTSAGSLEWTFDEYWL